MRSGGTVSAVRGRLDCAKATVKIAVVPSLTTSLPRRVTPPTDENVIANSPLAQLLEKDAVLFPEEVDRGLLAPIDPARVRGNRFRVRQGKGRITTLWSSTELLDPTVLEATK